MKPSTYPIRFKRLLILGAVIAGATASAAGAVQVGTPPDVQDAAWAAHTTPAGLRADGLRLQGIAQVYKQLQPAAPADVFERYVTTHSPGAGLSSVTDSTFVGRPPDVRDAAAGASSSWILHLGAVDARRRGRPTSVTRPRRRSASR